MSEATLSFVVFVPLVTGILLCATGKRLPERVWQSAGLAASLAVLGLCVPLWRGYDLVTSGYQFVERAVWIDGLGVSYFVGIDGISLMLVGLTTFLVPLVMLATWSEVRREVRSYVFFLLMLETCVLGALVSLNLFLFFVFWQGLWVPAYFLIGIWGGPQRDYAAGKLAVFAMLGAALMGTALLVLASLLQAQTGVLHFDWIAWPGGEDLGLIDARIPAWGSGAAWWSTQAALFAALGVAFGLQVPLVPVHTWLPTAHVEAPTGASVLLAGAAVELGAYGFVRFTLPLLPGAAADAGGLVGGLAAAGVVYGALLALVQSDLKRLVAYASLAHVGLAMLGVVTRNSQGISGGVLHLVNHGLSIAALVLLVGFLCERRQVRTISEFGGVVRPMPVFAGLFAVAVLANVGLPMLGGFVSELLVLIGTFEASPWAAVAAAAGMVVLAAALVSMYRRVVLGPVDNPENRGLIDLGWRERAVVLALLAPVVWLGVYPDAVLRRVEPSVVRTLRLIESRSAPAPPEPGRVAGSALSDDEAG